MVVVLFIKEDTKMGAKQTQSQRIVELMTLKKLVTRAQLAKKLGVKQNLVASYIAELVRVYGAKIEHQARSKEYRLLKPVEVSPFRRKAGK
jgi:predicted HTH transcriptional regulator